MRATDRKRGLLLALGLASWALTQGSAVSALPIALAESHSGVNWTSAGISGVGGGSGNIVVVGLSGTVTRAYLYWHGIDSSGTGAVYDNPSITFASNTVVGLPIGDSSTNCWGPGSSRAYRADVTFFVNGNGIYSVSGLSALAGHNANGASLVVIFDDGIASNDRDLAIFQGNDSSAVTLDPNPYPGEDDGWHASLPVTYSSGPVNAQLHVADGQIFPETALVFAADQPVTIPDDGSHYDGNTLPTAGTSRAAPLGDLWDIHNQVITGAFTSPGAKTLAMDGLVPGAGNDCVALVALLLDFAPGSLIADVAIGKTVSPDPVATGGVLTYTIAVTNNGPGTAAAALVTDALPAGTSFVSAGGAGWSCTQAAGNVACSAATLPLGAAPPITITVNAPLVAGSVANTALISSGTSDPTQSNDTATIISQVQGAGVAEIPTLSGWAIVCLSALLGGLGVSAVRRS